jgi:hypothetical protein
MAARAGRAPDDFLPRRLYRYDVRLAGLLDLRTPDARAAVDLSEDELLGDNAWTCQALGEAAQYLGREGVIAHSATGSGTVLAVFFDRLEPDSLVHVIDFQTWEALPSS